MKPYTASLRTQEGYKKAFGVVDGKYGYQFVLFAEGVPAMIEWFKNPQGKNLYFNLKEWEPQNHETAKPSDLDDTIPF